MIATRQSHFHFLPTKLESLTSTSCCCRLQKFSAIHKPTSRRNILLFSLPISTSLLLLSNPTPLSSAPLPSFDPVTPSEKDASKAFSQRISLAVGLLDRGRELQAQGDFILALDYFTRMLNFMGGTLAVFISRNPAVMGASAIALKWLESLLSLGYLWLMVVSEYKELALSEYARVGRALALYEVGDREEAIAEMEDVSISLKGYPEVHAALAAALYTDKHAPLLAENQFTIATMLDPHYTDISYVREIKHWPPSLVNSLQRFITLS